MAYTPPNRIIAARTREVRCGQCETRYRLTAQPSQASQTQAMQCPRCGASIRLDERTWVAQDVSSAFDVKARDAVASPTPAPTTPPSVTRPPRVPEEPFWAQPVASPPPVPEHDPVLAAPPTPAPAATPPDPPIARHQALAPRRARFAFEARMEAVLRGERAQPPVVAPDVMQAEHTPVPSYVPEVPKAPQVESQPDPAPVKEQTRASVKSVHVPVVEGLVQEHAFVGSGGRAWLVVVGVCGVALAFVAGVVVTRNTTPEPVIVPVELPIDDVIDTASTTVHLAALRDSSSVALRRQVARSLMRDGRVKRALGLLSIVWADAAHRDPQTALVYAEALGADEQWTRSREVALRGLLKQPLDEALQGAFRDAIAQDPALKPAAVTLVVGEHMDAVRALGGGKSVSFKLRKDNKNVYAFKPDQSTWPRGWRVEVAAYRLCQLLSCDFHVPVNQTARVQRDSFDALYNAYPTTFQLEYGKRFEELVDRRDAAPDGTSTVYLYGVIKTWLPRFINWPLEITSVWEPWMSQQTPASSVRGLGLRRALKGLKKVQGGRFYRGMLQEREAMTTWDFADQISQMIVFDVLVSNWDRFSSVRSYYGANTHYGQGRLISLDNGAAFHTQRMAKVDALLSRVERFSRTQITALRALNPDALNEVLFPEATALEGQRLGVFWEQRERVLEHVDALVARHGEEAVLCFD